MPDIAEIVESLSRDFSIEKLSLFLLHKNKNFTLYCPPKRLYQYEGEIFSEIYKIGKLFLNDKKELLAFAVKTQGELIERNSKKAQYVLAKTLLKLFHAPSGIFVFFDSDRNFRFSLVYEVYSGIEATFSHYRRQTYNVAKDKQFRTFKKAMTEARFDSLESVVSAFSTEPLRKEFYGEIKNWYAWALKHAKFPGGNIEENLIRLLIRLIFVWFLKERKLIPDKIFNPEYLKNVVANYGKGDFYYNTILQNLFFSTLNRYPQDRRFIQNGDFFTDRQESEGKNLYHYKGNILIDESDFIKIFEDITLINSGLFECIDDHDNLIDGFSIRDDKRARLPDFLFFSDEIQEKLSDFNGKRKRARVRGLINILKDYSFTLDESSPIDIEVSLDPELLGYLFENLLTSYNPETKTTTRKVTGSYYTPKEIVDFMIEESLLEYFKSKTNIDEQKLRDILSYSEEPIELTDEEKKLIVNSIDSLKLIDPAVGSGAFPIGVVHKLVHILNKIDPDNRLWYELQLSKAIYEIEEVLNIKDKEEKNKLLKELNENFNQTINYPDYARKLYIIENSIYGVDIQNIAIQICKLRFFLSLLTEQKIDKTKPNFGIKSLTHLETNFIAANILIGLSDKAQLKLESGRIEYLKRELKDTHKKYFTSKTINEKKRLINKAKEIKEKITELLSESNLVNETAEKIANLDIFSETAPTDWFDPELMFGVDNGFDIVIGNPPYVRQEKIKHIKPLLQSQGYRTYDSSADLYVYFYEKGFQLLRNEGILCFISSNRWMRAKYGERLRKFLKENTQIIKIIDFGGFPIFQQTVDTSIIVSRKRSPSPDWKIQFVNVPSTIQTYQKAIEYIKSNLNSINQNKLSKQVYVLTDERVLKIKEKLEKIGIPLRDWDVKIYYGIKTGCNEAFIINNDTRDRILNRCMTLEERKITEELIKPVLRGRDIERYCFNWAKQWVIVIPSGWTNKHRKGQNPENFFKSALPALYDYLISWANDKVQKRGKGLLNRDDQGDYWWELRPCDYYNEFEKEKIVWQRVSKEQKFTLVPSGFYSEDTAHFITGSNLRFILGILNSSLFGFSFYKFYIGGGIEGEIKSEFIGRFPIVKITENNNHLVYQIESLVTQIINLKNQDCSVDTFYLESQIDKLVYKLYDLTQEEIAITERNLNNGSKIL